MENENVVFKKDVNAVFRKLRKAGYFAEQNFWCCQTCAWADIDKDVEKVVFYHKQDADSFKNSRLISTLHLAWDGNGKEICDIIESCGLKYEWDGSEKTRIKILPWR